MSRTGVRGAMAALGMALSIGLAACSDSPQNDETGNASSGAVPAQAGMGSRDGMALPVSSNLASLTAGDTSAAARDAQAAAPQNLDPGSLPGVGAMQPGMMPGHVAAVAR